MPEMTISTAGALDSNITGVYAVGLIDAPGVATTNVFASLFNPVGSGRLLAITNLIWGKYVATTATTAASMGFYKITAASAGTDSSTAITPLNPFSAATAKSIFRTGNPTVTLGNILLQQAPPLSAGSFNNAPAITIAATTAAGALLLSEGEGIAIRTASGDVNQRWNVTIGFLELSVNSVETV
jgi:hypothetical protein